MVRDAPLYESLYIGLTSVLSVLTLPREVLTHVFDKIRRTDMGLPFADDLCRSTTFGSADYSFLRGRHV